MKIIEALNIIKSNNIAIAPFFNYEAANQITFVDNGTRFKSNEDFWPIDSINYSSQGNLNVTFKIPGVMIEEDGTAHECKEIRTITIVKNGEIKLQYLQLNKDKTAQAQLIAAGIEIKNNIVDLSKYELCDTIAPTVRQLFEAFVDKTICGLHTVSNRHQVELTEEQRRLANLGLRPDGYYCKPVVAQVTVEANDKVVAKIKKLSTKTTALANALRETVDVSTLSAYKFNELLYNAKCHQLHCDELLKTKRADFELEGSLKI